MPSNTSAGLFIGVFSLVMGFAGVWHITWLAAVALIAIAATVIARSFGNNEGYYISAETVKEIEGRRRASTAAGRGEFEVVEA